MEKLIKLLKKITLKNLKIYIIYIIITIMMERKRLYLRKIKQKMINYFVHMNKMV
jgi:hypothetical protein